MAVPETLAVNVCDAPGDTMAGLGSTVTFTGTAELIMTASDAAFEGSAAGVAVIVTWSGDGASEGAVYIALLPAPVPTIVPHAAPAQPAPDTLQEIIMLGLEFATGVSVAAKLPLPPAVTAEGPFTLNVKWLIIVSAMDALFDGSATLVAVSSTVGGEGSICGAVKTPFGVAVPHALPAHPAPSRVQLVAVVG